MHIYCKKHGLISTEPTFTLADIERRRDEITDDEIKEALKHPSDFGWHGREEMFDTWSLGFMIRTRDSSILEESNAAMLEQALEESTHDDDDCLLGLFHEDDYELNSCNHWACGWVEYVSFRAVNDDGTPTEVFAFMMLWNDMLSNYPCADEEDFSRREWEAAVEYVDDVLRSRTRDDLPDDWCEQILRDIDEIPRDNYGNDEEIERIAEEKGFLEDA